MTSSDRTFDQTLRRHHQSALMNLSPQVQARLAQHRHAAMRGVGPARRHLGFRYAAASLTAVAVLAFGLHMQRLPEPTLATPAAAVAEADIGTTEAPSMLSPHDTTALKSRSPAATAALPATLLDEDPEFYAWLASTDAQLVALEE